MLLPSSAERPRHVALVLAAAAIALIASVFAAPALHVGAAARGATPAPKIVLIVGQSGRASANIAESDTIAELARSYGMDVRKVYAPNATWQNVLSQIQGAKIVVYMGHGNGWPSPYGPFQTLTKDGFGLNPYAGSSSHKYYGEGPIAENIKLAPNAIVLLNHLCYASGNAEPGMALPTASLAAQRVDNYAAGFLKAGARAVYAYGHQSVRDVLRLLYTTNQTLDGVFMTPSGTKGFNGARDQWFSSTRTPGKRLHVDPYPNGDYYRAVTGDLSMTTAEFRGTGSSDTTAPTLSSVKPVAGWGTPRASSTDPVPFTPNGDAFTERLRVNYSGLSEVGTLDVAVSAANGATVRAFSVAATASSGAFYWDGRSDARAVVADGTYTISVTPRDKAGNRGTARTTRTAVLTTLRSFAVGPRLFYAADGDDVAGTTTLSVDVQRSASVTWNVTDTTGTSVTTERFGEATDPGSLVWSWDGRDRDGNLVPAGTYHGVISATTDAGTVVHRVSFTNAAFSVSPSVSSGAGGDSVTFTVTSAEPLGTAPTLTFTQPDLEPTSFQTTLVTGQTYRVTVPVQPAGGAGLAAVRVVGVDAAGHTQATTTTFSVR